MEAVEERVDRLETIFGQFMAQTNRTIQRLDQNIVEIRQEIVEIRRETSEIRRETDEMRRESAQTVAEIRRETDETTAEIRRETAQTVAEIRRETAQTVAEIRRETDEIRRETDATTAEIRRETAQTIAEIRRETDALTRESRRHTIEMARLAHRIGRFAEDFVNPNIPRLARESFGIVEFEFEGWRVKRRHSTAAGRSREFDCLVIGNRHFVVSEARLTARVSDVNEFAEGVRDVFDYFPEYRDYTVVPIFASLALDPDLVRRLTRLRIYALALGEHTMELLNLEQVRARRR